MEKENFYLNFKEEIFTVERFDVAGQAFFLIAFPVKVQPLTILRAKHFSGNEFWTSMPEGRQQLAEEIGILIEQYYRSIK